MKEYKFSGKFKEDEFYKFVVRQKEIVHEDGILFVYRGSEGAWIRADDMKVKQALNNYIPSDKRAGIKPVSIDNVVRKLKCDPDIYRKMSDIADANKEFLNVSDGIISLKTGKRMKRDKNRYFTYCLNFNYKPHPEIAKCESFMQFVSTSLENNTDRMTRLLEIMGYVVSSLSGAEKAFMLVGVSNSGKSVMLNLIERVVGEENTTSFPIDKLGDKFNLGELKYSLININREISGSGLRNLDIFKSICSSERITGEQKYGSPFSFHCRSKLLFAGNCLPEIKKVDGSNNEAVFNRFCVLYFPKGLTDEEKDLTLEQRLFDDRDTIFSAAIEALRKLMKRNLVFTEDTESTKYLESYKASNQALKHFVEECCIRGAGYKIHTKNFIAALKKYCDENALSYQYSSEIINAYVGSLEGVERGKFRMGGSTPLNGFIGIKLKPSPPCNDIKQD